jgi:hypothetical protein
MGVKMDPYGDFWTQIESLTLKLSSFHLKKLFLSYVLILTIFQMAQQMQQANPELVEQLRRQFGGMGGENPDDNNSTGGGPGQNPPSQ